VWTNFYSYFSVTYNLAPRASARRGWSGRSACRCSPPNASGVLFHYPAAQIDRTVRGMEAIANGETYNPLALAVGPPRKSASR
jgi:hypothetical protein